MDRREFLASLGAAIAGASAIGCAHGAASQMESAGTSVAPKPLGIQLYTVRSLMEKDVEGTLASIAQIGYREVEPAGMFGKTAAEFRAILDRHGLRAPSAHIPLQQLRGDAIQQSLADARTLGLEYVTCPWIDESERTAEGFRRIAADFNTIGAAVKQAGMQFAYHNHDFEFKPLAGASDGALIYDTLLAQTDPQLVKMEMDLFWITNGGHDPLEYFNKYPGRFPMVHVKDRMANGTMTEVGSGAIDFRRIFAQASKAGIRHYFVEHDQPASPIESARASFQALRRLVA